MYPFFCRMCESMNDVLKNPCSMFQFIHNIGLNYHYLCQFFLYPIGYVIWVNSSMHAQDFMWDGQIHLLTSGDCYY